MALFLFNLAAFKRLRLHTALTLEGVKWRPTWSLTAFLPSSHIYSPTILACSPTFSLP